MSTSTKWSKKYIARLADVYLQKYDTLGYAEAKAWYDEFLSAELRRLVHPVICDKVKSQQKDKKK